MNARINKSSKTNAQRASSDSTYSDPYSKQHEYKWNGETVRTTNYSDGSSTVHHGGPCGSVNYDEFGEEC